MINFVSFLNAAILAGTPLLLATLGEILTEKSGNLNLGVEGMMAMGAVAGLCAPYIYEMNGGSVTIVAVILSLVFAFAFGALGGAVYSFLTVTLRANQNVTGLSLTIFGVGFGNFIGEAFREQAGGYVSVGEVTKAGFANMNIPALTDIPVIGRMFFHYNFLVYLAVILAVLMSYFFMRTRKGLSLRAVGESPSTADAAGLNVTKYKYAATILGGGLCGLGGMYVSMVNTSGTWNDGCIGGLGWIAVALVIFATWSPLRAILGSIVFGALSVMRMYVSIPGLSMQIYAMLPYIATILVLIITSIRQIKEHSQPASCGNNYFREDR
ncbi:MAG: ABC transporter permease [Clostridia bacterium]|nr:ABC transporter permease [Clostridia bacterium]